MSISKWVYQFVKKANSKLNIKNRVKAKITRIKNIHDIFSGYKYSLFRHVAVMSHKSPFDNDWMYLSKRKNKQYGGVKSKILTRQKFKCSACNLKFAVDDQIELHHIDRNHKNNLHENLFIFT